jgi:hypothetical protein
MNTPKPAPSKPLTFTPPQYLKGETQSSELPTVEGADSNVVIKQHRRADGFRNANALLAATGLPKAKTNGKRKGVRPSVVIIDEIMHPNGAVELVFESDRVAGVTDDKPAFDAAQAKSAEKKEAKKPFVLDPRLTQRPFHDDRLMQLKNRMQRPSFKNR